MVNRIVNLTKTNSFFLFGARGTGKTTLLKQRFNKSNALYIDLLDPDEEELFARTPVELKYRVEALSENQKWVIIDEIQKVPKLLNLVHKLIESTHRYFILTGSSSRKLKRGAANLLAGRAFVYHLYPFTSTELENQFTLNTALQWGTLPKVYSYKSEKDKQRFLKSYVQTYLREEIVAEQLIRNLDPFRHFLEVAAQSSGKIVNYSKIAQDIGVDTKTVQGYFSILEDTLIGIKLPSFHKSIRKQQNKNPKFYLFDTGVKRALERTLSLGIREGTYAYGELFEHFIISEIIRLSDYQENEWRFSYLRTKDDAEIDLIIDRPGKPLALIEIKSTSSITERAVSTLNRFSKDIDNSESFCLSCDQNPKRIGNVNCIYWQHFLKDLVV